MNGSRLRRAFRQAVAARGRQKEIASEAFADRSIEAAETETTRILGEHADRRPTFELLAAALIHGDPEPVLDCIGELCRVRWERLPEEAEIADARMRHDLRALREGVEQLQLRFEQELARRERKPALRARPREPEPMRRRA